jgi:hypothetical protein
MQVMIPRLLLLLFAVFISTVNYSIAFSFRRGQRFAIHVTARQIHMQQFDTPKVIKQFSIIAPVLISLATTINPVYTSAKDELPSLEKIFNAVRKELSPDGESLSRLRADIDKENWEDILTFTREYDAGFRGGVLKSAWKQLGDNKGRGIELSNSFTFDLIALNKAARSHDKDEAVKRLDQVRQDLVSFEALDPSKPSAGK